MHLRDFAFVMCRLFAICLLVVLVIPFSTTTFAYLLFDTAFLSPYGWGRNAGWILGFMLLYGLPATFLWFKAGYLATLIAPVQDDQVSLARASIIQEVAFSFLGLVLLVDSLRQAWAILFLAFWRARANIYEGPINVLPGSIANIVFLFAIGMFLLLGSRRIISFLRYLRYAGT